MPDLQEVGGRMGKEIWKNENKTADAIKGLAILAIAAVVVFSAIHRNRRSLQGIRNSQAEVVRAQLLGR
jgi:hypothetical protein